METILNDIKSGFQNCVNFSGRASQREFIVFALFCIILGGIISSLLGSIAAILSWIFCIVVFLAILAISVRRLHDTGHSGLWALLYLLPLINLILLIYLCVAKSK